MHTFDSASIPWMASKGIPTLSWVISLPLLSLCASGMVLSPPFSFPDWSSRMNQGIPRYSIICPPIFPLALVVGSAMGS